MIVELIKKNCYLVNINNHTLTAKNEATSAKFLKSLENNLIITFSIIMFRKNKILKQISAVTETVSQL